MRGLCAFMLLTAAALPAIGAEWTTVKGSIVLPNGVPIPVRKPIVETSSRNETYTVYKPVVKTEYIDETTYVNETSQVDFNQQRTLAEKRRAKT